MGRHHPDWIVVGISGVTCGGKTTLSNKLLNSVAPSCVLHQDKYFLPDDHPAHVRVPGLAQPHNNYDILSALDMKQMYRDTLSTLEGSMAAHGCNETARGGGGGGGGGLRAPGRGVLIIEGFTALNYRPIYDLCDLRYYFVLEYGECFSRRVHRLYDPPDVAGYFEACVWPEHVRYRAELEHDPHVRMLDGTRMDNYDVVVSDLKRLGVREAPSSRDVTPRTLASQ